MTVKVTVDLHDVEVEVEEDQVLDEMSCADLVTYTRDTHGLRELLSEIRNEDLLEHVCDDDGTETVVKTLLEEMTKEGVADLFKELGYVGREPLNVEFLAIDAAATPETYWVRVGGVTRFMLAQDTLFTKHGVLTARSREEAHRLAHVLAIGLASEL